MEGKKMLIKDCELFAIIPIEIIHGVSGAALKVFASLASHQENFQPSTGQMALDTNLSKITVYKALKELQTKGIINNTHYMYCGSGFKKQKLYKFCPKHDWNLKEMPQPTNTPVIIEKEVVDEGTTSGRREFVFPTSEEKLASYKRRRAEKKLTPEGL